MAWVASAPGVVQHRVEAAACLVPKSGASLVEGLAAFQAVASHPYEDLVAFPAVEQALVAEMVAFLALVAVGDNRDVGNTQFGCVVAQRQADAFAVIVRVAAAFPFPDASFAVATEKPAVRAWGHPCPGASSAGEEAWLERADQIAGAAQPCPVSSWAIVMAVEGASPAQALVVGEAVGGAGTDSNFAAVGRSRSVTADMDNSGLRYACSRRPAQVAQRVDRAVAWLLA